MHEIILPIPTDVTETVRNRVKRRMADTYGGYTATVATGGWLAPDGETVTETVEVITCVADETADVSPATFGQVTASHVADETDETEVMWYARPVADMGFES